MPTLSYDLYPADRGEYAESLDLENANRLSRTASPPVAMFDLFQFDPGPFRVADGTRWAATGTNALAGIINLTATASGATVVNVLAGDQGKLANLNVGDPVVLTSDQASTGPFETAAEISASSATWKRSYYTAALVVAKTATTITLSKALPTAITASGTLTYYWTDYAHPTASGYRARWYAITNPTRKRYQHYLGTILGTVNQLSSGNVASGGATIAGATADFLTLPILPGLDDTANAVFNVTLAASGAQIAFAPAACKAGQLHVARVHLRTKTVAAKGLDCWVEDGSGNRVSEIINAAGLAGSESVNVPFFAASAGNYGLKIKQNSATDASFWAAQVEYRSIPADGFEPLIPTTGPVIAFGDSNLYQPVTQGTVAAVLGNNLLGTSRADLYGVTGRTQSQQTEDLKTFLATVPTRYALAINHETANSMNAIRTGTGDNVGPLGTLGANYIRYGGNILYAKSIWAGRADLVLFLGQSRAGELSDGSLLCPPIAAKTSRTQRDALSATP